MEKTRCAAQIVWAISDCYYRKPFTSVTKPAPNDTTWGRTRIRCAPPRMAVSRLLIAFSQPESCCRSGSKAAAQTVNRTQLAKEHAAAQEFMAGKVGKTAANFKAATAEQRAASVATQELTQKTQGLIGAYSASRGSPDKKVGILLQP